MEKRKEVMKNESLDFVLDQNWQKAFKNREIKEDFRNLKEHLVPAERGIKYCVDERPINRVLEGGEIEEKFTYNQKAALPGGSLFWVTLFRALGQDLDEALTLTKRLHQFMGWGKMEIHIDDHHGALENVLQGKEEVLGCGFLGVSAEVVKALKKSFASRLPFQELDSTPLSQVVNQTYQAGARVIELTGEHKAQEAAYVINLIPNTTLPQPQLYSTPTPAFVTDLWIVRDVNTNGQTVAEVLNSLLEKELFTPSLLEEVTFLATLKTAQLLSAYRQDNIVLISKNGE